MRKSLSPIQEQTADTLPKIWLQVQSIIYLANDFDTERIKVIFNSKKVTDHHAIIPTVSSLSEDLSGIPESEARYIGLFLISSMQVWAIL